MSSIAACARETGTSTTNTSDAAIYATKKRPKISGFMQYMPRIHEELEGASADKIELYATKSLSVLGDVAPSYIVVKAISGAISDLSANGRISSDEVVELIMSIASTVSARADVDILQRRTIAERFINETINVTCGPFCTQPGTDFRSNTACPGFISLYMTPCPCTPFSLDEFSSMIDAPLFKGGVFLKSGYVIEPGRTIFEYTGDKMSGDEFDALDASNPRRKHAILVGDKSDRLVPLTPCGRPEIKNYAARVRDAGRTGTPNCQLFEDASERLWLVSLDKIYGGTELLIDFHDDGIDDEEAKDATYKP
jgi:hypothetical protein